MFSGGLALCRLAPFPLSLGLRGLAFLFCQLILLSPGDDVSPSSFGRSGLSFFSRLVLPLSSDGCAGHSGFPFLVWLVSPPSSDGCVVSLLPLVRQVFHRSEPGIDSGLDNPVSFPNSEPETSGETPAGLVWAPGPDDQILMLMCCNLAWSGSRPWRPDADVDVLACLSQDSPLASSGRFRSLGGWVLQCARSSPCGPVALAASKKRSQKLIKAT